MLNNPERPTDMNESNIPTWDADNWMERYMCAQNPVNQHALNQLRMMVAFSTTEIIKHRHYISESGKHIEPDWNPFICEQTRFYDKEIHPQSLTTKQDTVITIVQTDCLTQARKMIQKNHEPVCVLNMANANSPGGSVSIGGGGQEEYLFRCSDYQRSLFQFDDFGTLYGLKRSEKSYPLDRNFGGIFTPGATIFRDTEENGYALLDEPYTVNFIAVAGIKRPQMKLIDGEEQLADQVVTSLRNRIRTFFRIAIENKQENLILGSLGTGSYPNPTKHIATLFKETLEESEFSHGFKNVVFTIKNGPKNSNLNAIKSILR